MTPTRLESLFQSDLKKDLADIFPGCVIIKNNPNYQQGIPDLIILFRNKWAVLECKRSEADPYRPNQEYFLEFWNSMSFASVIHPPNYEEVLHALQAAFRTAR